MCYGYLNSLSVGILTATPPGLEFKIFFMLLLIYDFIHFVFF